jgi:hypothetical protein
MAEDGVARAVSVSALAEKTKVKARIRNRCRLHIGTTC